MEPMVHTQASSTFSDSLASPSSAQKSAEAVAQLRGGLHGEGNGEHLVDGLQTAGRLLAGEQPVGDAPLSG